MKGEQGPQGQPGAPGLAAEMPLLPPELLFQSDGSFRTRRSVNNKE